MTLGLKHRIPSAINNNLVFRCGFELFINFLEWWWVITFKFAIQDIHLLLLDCSVEENVKIV